MPADEVVEIHGGDLVMEDVAEDVTDVRLGSRLSVDRLRFPHDVGAASARTRITSRFRSSG
jgi:hypothetical protein